MTDSGTSPETSLPTSQRARRPYLVPVIAVLAIGLIIAGFGLALNQSGTDRLSGGIAPGFDLTTFSGQPFRLSDKRGKVVFVNFWASWCGPCRDEAPMLNVLWDEFKPRGVEFIGIGYLDNRSDALGFIQDTAMSYPAAPDDGGKVSAAYKVKGVPQTYIIDKKGNIAFVMLDPLTTTNLNAVRALLERLTSS